jgi:hypothetical protein
MIKGYTTKEVAQLLAGASNLPVTRQAVSILAKRKGWRRIGKEGKMTIFHPEDVETEVANRRRTNLLLINNWWRPRFGGELNKDEDLDMVCPICGASAVRNPMLPFQWACVNGHKKGAGW